MLKVLTIIILFTLLSCNPVTKLYIKTKYCVVDSIWYDNIKCVDDKLDITYKYYTKCGIVITKHKYYVKDSLLIDYIDVYKR